MRRKAVSLFIFVLMGVTVVAAKSSGKEEVTVFNVQKKKEDPNLNYRNESKFIAHAIEKE